MSEGETEEEKRAREEREARAAEKKAGEEANDEMEHAGAEVEPS